MSIFGHTYVKQSLVLLQILVISSIPVAINDTGIAIFRIRKEVKPLIIVMGIQTFVTCIAGYILLGAMGLIGIGVAWLCAQAITMIIIVLLNMKYLRSAFRITTLDGL